MFDLLSLFSTLKNGHESREDSGQLGIMKKVNGNYLDRRDSFIFFTILNNSVLLWSPPAPNTQVYSIPYLYNEDWHNLMKMQNAKEPPGMKIVLHKVLFCWQKLVREDFKCTRVFGK